MKYFVDKELKSEVKRLKLGIVTAGETRQFTFFVQNDTSSHWRDLAFEATHPEVTVVKAPVMLDPSQAGELIVEWKPTVTLKEGLETRVMVVGDALYGRLD